MRVYVNYQDKRWKKYDIDFNKIANAVVGRMYENSEVSITLVDDNEMRRINRKYRKINKPTNVLSFELSDPFLLGDIFISLDTVRAQAKEEGISFDAHVAHMVVHGVLHLMGYDHIDDDDAEKMEKKETTVLKKLGYKNPYADNDKKCKDGVCCPGGHTIYVIKKFFHRPIGRVVMYMVCGVLAALGFAPFNLWFMTLFGIGGAYLLSLKYLTGHSVVGKFFRILPFSGIYAIAMFWWVVHSIYVVPELTKQLAIWTLPALIGIGIVGGIIFAIPFVAVTGKRMNPASRPFLFAAVWTVVLWAREWVLTGFPWNPIANIAINNLYIANSMSLYGALGLTFVIIGIIASICEIIRNRRDGMNWMCLIAFIVFGVVGILYGIKNVHYINSLQIEQGPLIRIVQPAQSAVQKATYSRQAAIQNADHNLRTMTLLALSDGEYDLAVFPETAYPFVMVPGDIMSLGQILAKPVIVGSNYFVDGKLYNSLLVSDANGNVTNVYHKSHLVPFGEYRPIGNLIPTPGMLTAGKGPEIINMKIKRQRFVFAPAVCYEIIFSDSLLPKDSTPSAIVNITNDNWFGKTPGTYQHLDMVRRYAVESGLPIVRANYSGISAFVSSDGRVIASIPIGESGVIDGKVWGAHKTVYRYLGRDMWMIIILIVSCLATIWISETVKNRK
jgi:apolipoprotein N-acyltransferase